MKVKKGVSGGGPDRRAVYGDVMHAVEHVPGMVKQGSYTEVSMLLASLAQCVQPDQDTVERPTRTLYQNLMRHSGIHTMLLQSIIVNPLVANSARGASGGAGMHYAGTSVHMEVLLRKTFELLANFCTDNPDNQRVLSSIATIIFEGRPYISAKQPKINKYFGRMLGECPPNTTVVYAGILLRARSLKQLYCY